jgi:hypothetical protein
MEYKVTTIIEYGMTVEPPELPAVDVSSKLDEAFAESADMLSDILSGVITEYLTERANSVWVDTANERMIDLPKEDDIRKAMIQELDRFITPNDWYNEAVDCIDNWMLDDTVTHNYEELIIEEGY